MNLRKLLPRSIDSSVGLESAVSMRGVQLACRRRGPRIRQRYGYLSGRCFRQLRTRRGFDVHDGEALELLEIGRLASKAGDNSREAQIDVGGSAPQVHCTDLRMTDYRLTHGRG